MICPYGVGGESGGTVAAATRADTGLWDFVLRWRGERNAGRPPLGWLDSPQWLVQAVDAVERVDALNRQRQRDEERQKAEAGRRG